MLRAVRRALEHPPARRCEFALPFASPGRNIAHSRGGTERDRISPGIFPGSDP
jgi:hypothetical protein